MIYGIDVGIYSAANVSWKQSRNKNLQENASEMTTEQIKSCERKKNVEEQMSSKTVNGMTLHCDRNLQQHHVRTQ